MALTGAEKQAAYKKTQKGRIKNAELEAKRRARLKGEREPFRISEKSVRRDEQRLVENRAGTPQAIKNRQKRVALAERRAAATGSSRPKRPDPRRGGHGVRATSTGGHQTPARFAGTGEGVGLTKEGNYVRQTPEANFGKGGQGASTLREWDAKLRKRGLMLDPSRPTETIRIKDMPKNPMAGMGVRGGGLLGVLADPAIMKPVERFIGRQVFGEKYKTGRGGLGVDLLKAGAKKIPITGIKF